MTKILVIEDEPILREEIVDLLTFESYEALGAKDGPTGITSAIQYQPDLILCDVTMPGLDGYEVLKELRKTPTTRHIPLIFMTAHAAQDDIQRGIGVGAEGYVTKPFYHKDLIEAIQACLNKK